MNALQRFLRRMNQTDEERLAEEVRSWAETIPGTVRIADAPLRMRSKLAGLVRRITILPVEGLEALEIVLWDGTGEITAVWLGRRSIAGLALGSRLIVEGVIGVERNERRIVNPTFEFA